MIIYKNFSKESLDIFIINYLINGNFQARIYRRDY